MKVALLTNFIPPYRVSFFNSIAKNVDELIVFISTPMEQGRQWPVDWAGLDVRLQKTITIRRTWKHPHGFKESLYTHFPTDTLSLLQKTKPDWIISGEFGARTLHSVFYKLLNPKTKLAIWATLSEYSEMGRGFVRELIRKWIIPKADLIFVNGKSGEKYIRRFGFPKEKIVYIPYTINLSPFLNINIHRDQPSERRLLYSGQLIQRKGLFEFHNAFCKWAQNHPEKTWEWWCIGDGPLREQLQNLPVPQNVIFKLFGNINYSDLVKYYQGAGVLIFPTLADEWGVVVNEAMASGLPILGSIYSQAVEELIEEGKTGWLFRPDHSEEIYLALDRYYATSDENLMKMRHSVRNKIVNFTPEIIAEELVQSLRR